MKIINLRSHQGVFAVVALMSMALPVAADSIKVDMQPGLWENNIRYTGDGAAQMQQLQATQMEQAMAEMKQHLAAMPAEQRQQMEALMAQSGMQMNEQGLSFNDNRVQMSSEGIVTKQCVTQEQIDSGELSMDSDGECRSSITQVARNRIKSVQECEGEGASRTESEILFESPKRFTGTGVMNQIINGQAHQVTVAVEGRWLASDCGAVAP